MSKGNYEHIITGITKDRIGRDVMQIALRDKKQPCRECGKEPRADHSSRCTKCTAAHKQYIFGQDRLRKKVEKQANINS